MNSLSIIIPVLNEEKYIADILNLLAKQTYKNFEVIVVDGKSTDKTIEILENYKALGDKLKIIKARHKGVSHQRNLGASRASYDTLLFFDADARFSDNFLEKAINKFINKKADIASCSGVPKEKDLLEFILSFLYNHLQKITKRFYPILYGWMMMAGKQTHDGVNGFDEKLYFAEDTDYAQKIVKNGGKFEILTEGDRDLFIHYSTRRIKSKGRVLFEVKMIKYFIYSLFLSRYDAQKKSGY